MEKFASRVVCVFWTTYSFKQPEDAWKTQEIQKTTKEKVMLVFHLLLDPQRHWVPLQTSGGNGINQRRMGDSG